MFFTKDSHFYKFDETDKLIIGHYFEDAYLVNKEKNEEIYLDNFYCEPYCGLISLANDWCVVAGYSVCVWRNNEIISLSDNVNLQWIVEIRLSAPDTVELMINPYSENGAIWQLDIITLASHKVRDHKKIREEFTGTYDW